MLRLYCYESDNGNFGDDLNRWLWPKLLPDLVNTDRNSREFTSDDILFVGIGSLLNHFIPVEPRKVIFGPGIGYGSTPITDDRWKIYFVRGPLSASALGVSQDIAITDAAALIRLIDICPQEKRFGTSFIPHHQGSDSVNWKKLCPLFGIHYIDPTGTVETVLSEIQGSDLVLAEAMHGAIVADALRVPWIPVQVHASLVERKWQDWCMSLDLRYEPVRLPRIGLAGQTWTASAKRAARMMNLPSVLVALHYQSRFGTPVLSSDSAIERATRRLEEKVTELRDDFRNGMLFN